MYIIPASLLLLHFRDKRLDGKYVSTLFNDLEVKITEMFLEAHIYSAPFLVYCLQSSHSIQTPKFP